MFKYNWWPFTPTTPNYSTTCDAQASTEKTPAAKDIVYTLSIDFYDGTQKWWSNTTTKDLPKQVYWEDFLKWFHGRENSEIYTIQHRNSNEEGSTTFRKKDIKRYFIYKTFTS